MSRRKRLNLRGMSDEDRAEWEEHERTLRMFDSEKFTGWINEGILQGMDLLEARVYAVKQQDAEQAELFSGDGMYES